MEPKELAPKASLAPDEVEALERLPADRRLSPQAAAQLYVLFLQGYSNREIAGQNPDFGGHALGLVVRANLDFGWEKERQLYTRELMSKVQSTVEHATLEGIRFTHDAMAAFQKMAGTKVRKYLKTGDESDLGSALQQMSIKQYRDLVEMFKAFTEPMVTAANAVPPVLPTTLPQEQTVEGTVVRQVDLPTDRPPTTEETSQLLEMLAGGKPRG